MWYGAWQQAALVRMGMRMRLAGAAQSASPGAPGPQAAGGTTGSRGQAQSWSDLVVAPQRGAGQLLEVCPRRRLAEAARALQGIKQRAALHMLGGDAQVCGREEDLVQGREGRPSLVMVHSTNSRGAGGAGGVIWERGQPRAAPALGQASGRAVACLPQLHHIRVAVRLQVVHHRALHPCIHLQRSNSTALRQRWPAAGGTSSGGGRRDPGMRLPAPRHLTHRGAAGEEATRHSLASRRAADFRRTQRAPPADVPHLQQLEMDGTVRSHAKPKRSAGPRVGRTSANSAYPDKLPIILQLRHQADR